jgi:hypothetical protein
MKKLKRAVLIGASTALMLGVLSAPASATINLVNSSSIQGENVLFNDGAQSGTTIFGTTNQSNTSVKFTSTAPLLADGGQAAVTGGLDLSTNSPVDTVNYNNLAISLGLGGNFNNLELGLFGGNATSVTFTLIDNLGTVFSFANLALGGGSNLFGFQGVDGETIQSASFVTTGGTGIQSTKLVRLDAQTLVSAAPEPATWGLLIVGFFGAGMAVRKSRTSGTSKRASVA